MAEIRFTSYEEARQFLREFTTWHADPAAYDFGGAFNLWTSLLENMRERSVPEDLDQYAATLTEGELVFLERIVAAARKHGGPRQISMSQTPETPQSGQY